MANLSTNVAVFVPSHIHYDGQIELLSKCLDNLINQTFEASIFVSVSFEDQYKSNIVDLMKQYGQVKFALSSKQFFQLEHLEILTNKYATLYDLIMFCNDDDYFDINRINDVVNSKYNVLLLVEHKSFVNNDAEYYRYIVKPKILITFFEKMRKIPSLMHCNIGKIFLNIYLFKNIDSIQIESMTNGYVYNYDNQNSLTNTQSIWKQEDDEELIYAAKNKVLNKKILKNKNDKVTNIMNIVNKFCYEHLLL